jgi:hypothetical protein
VVEALKGLVHELQPFLDPLVNGGGALVLAHAAPVL